MKKINIAKILKNCPQDMELYSPLCGDCKLYSVNDYNITIEIPNRDSLIILRRDGTYCANGEIMIFPKGKTTWKGFVPPRKFKTGDIIFTTCASGNTWISIFKKKGAFGEVETYVDYNTRNNNLNDCYINTYGASLCTKKDIATQRLATEEEKAKLLKAIEDKGYIWNAENETLERFIKPKFKVGDRIVHKVNKESPFIITEITKDCYKGGTQYEVLIEQQNNFELVPYKFDINSLVPFESKVLVRDDDYDEWRSAFWGHLRQKADMKYDTLRGVYRQCIPYEGNEHLLGKTNDCDNFYKTWE
jgi:hypothetical protein